MIMFKIRSILHVSGVSLLLIAAPAFAGAVPQVGFYRTSQKVKINQAIPVLCDANTAAGAATINGLGAKFKLTGANANFTTTYYSATQDPGFVNVQDASGLPVLMRTTINTIGGPLPQEYTDSTVSINADRLYYDVGDTAKSNDFVCGASITTGNIGTRIDFQSAMTHEFGHVMGMEHRSDGNTGPCVMHTNLSAGSIRRTFCADEKGLMVGFYGPG
jgi:hypothetical protein